MHKLECTDRLSKGIEKKGAAIAWLQARGVESVELMALEQELAGEHHKVVNSMMDSMLLVNMNQALTHSLQALHLHRKVTESVFDLRMITHTRTRALTHTQTHTNTHTHACRHAHIRTDTQPQTNIHTHMHIHMHTHMHTHAHTHCKKVEASRDKLRGAVAREAARKLAPKADPHGLYCTLFDLGQVYGFMSKYDDELQVYQQTLDEVRNDVAHATPELQALQSNILGTMGNVYIKKYESQTNNAAVNGVQAYGDKVNCITAKALFKESLNIVRTLRDSDSAVAEILIGLASAYSNLDLFDEARSTLKEALSLALRCFGNESAPVVECHSKSTLNSFRQVEAKRKEIFMHEQYMVTHSMSSYHSRGSRVLVEGLQKKLQYNGLEGVVVTMGHPRMRVRLDVPDNTEIMLKPRNVRPLIPTAEKLQEQFLKLQDLTRERIASSEEAHRIQVKMMGVKHVNTGIACHALGSAYLGTDIPSDAGRAVALLIQAIKLQRRVGDNDKERALGFCQALSSAQAALARFDEKGVLSAVPGCWRPTSRQEDATRMALLFTSLQVHNGNTCSASMSSMAMQQDLRLYGLFNVTVSSCDAVSGP